MSSEVSTAVYCPCERVGVGSWPQSNVLFANSLVLGLVANVVDILDKEIVLESLLDVIPKFHDQNRKAFEIGFDYTA